MSLIDVSPSVIVHASACIGGTPQIKDFNFCDPPLHAATPCNSPRSKEKGENDGRDDVAAQTLVSMANLGGKKLIVESDVVIREFAVITQGSEKCTFVGRQSYIMAHCVINHDCVLAPNVVMCSGSILAGHVHVGRNAYIGQGASVHQHVVVGPFSLVAMGMNLVKHLPPFCICMPDHVCRKVNYIGLVRAGFSYDEIYALAEMYAEHHGGHQYSSPQFWLTHMPEGELRRIAIADYCSLFDDDCPRPRGQRDVALVQICADDIDI